MFTSPSHAVNAVIKPEFDPSNAPEIDPDVRDRLTLARSRVNAAIVGKGAQVDLSLVCLLSGGHLLLEDAPGTGKTVLAKALAGVVDVPFSRVQFTPDLMPSDILGVSVYRPATQDFVLRKGPVFSGVMLADEINRGSSRTQSALLEAMAEGQVSIDGQTLELPETFMVIATQNPLDGVGTFPLPPAQKDRFLFSMSLGHPDRESEMDLLRDPSRYGRSSSKVGAILSASDLSEILRAGRAVTVSDMLLSYIHRLVIATREDGEIGSGLSTRAALALVDASRFRALLSGRGYAIPEDVQDVFIPLARHRIHPAHGAPAAVLDAILSRVAV